MRLSSSPVRWFSSAILLCTIGVASYSGGVSAQVTLGSGDNAKTIVIPKLTGEAEIDGALDDALWSQALLIDDFHQYEPVEYGEPSQKSQVWIFYTEDALYIGSFFEEADMSEVSANVMRQGQGLASDDILAVVLDPFFDRRNGYRFEVNANGVRWEGLFQLGWYLAGQREPCRQWLVWGDAYTLPDIAVRSCLRHMGYQFPALDSPQ